jgi:hypothetical protein
MNLLARMTYVVAFMVFVVVVTCLIFGAIIASG